MSEPAPPTGCPAQAAAAQCAQPGRTTWFNRCGNIAPHAPKKRRREISVTPEPKMMVAWAKCGMACR